MRIRHSSISRDRHPQTWQDDTLDRPEKYKSALDRKLDCFVAISYAIFGGNAKGIPAIRINFLNC
jgi:hypothetical protein